MRRRSLIASLFLALGLSVAPSLAAPVQLWYEKANGFYEQQQFDSARVYYEKIAGVGANADVYYNLGNSCYRLSQIGPALLYYEKALKLKPTDPDILANIRFANMNTIDRVPQPEQTFFGAIFHRLHMLLSLNTQLWLLFLTLTGISVLFSIGLFASHNARLWLGYGGAVCFLVALFLGISSGVKIYDQEKVAYAIVLAKAVDAKNEPNGSKVQFSAHEGTKFRIRQQVNGWSFVSLANGVCGWVPDDCFGKI
jgi:tetratricopeptide (TPR) repeat protein